MSLTFQHRENCTTLPRSEPEARCQQYCARIEASVGRNLFIVLHLKLIYQYSVHSNVQKIWHCHRMCVLAVCNGKFVYNYRMHLILKYYPMVIYVPLNRKLIFLGKHNIEFCMHVSTIKIFKIINNGVDSINGIFYCLFFLFL